MKKIYYGVYEINEKQNVQELEELIIKINKDTPLNPIGGYMQELIAIGEGSFTINDSSTAVYKHKDLSAPIIFKANVLNFTTRNLFKQMIDCECYAYHFPNRINSKKCKIALPYLYSVVEDCGIFGEYCNYKKEHLISYLQYLGAWEDIWKWTHTFLTF